MDDGSLWRWYCQPAPLRRPQRRCPVQRCGLGLTFWLVEEAGECVDSVRGAAGIRAQPVHALQHHDGGSWTPYPRVHNMTITSLNKHQRSGTVQRRYSEFAFLWDCLVRRYPFRLLPQLPPKRIGRKWKLFFFCTAGEILSPFSQPMSRFWSKGGTYLFARRLSACAGS